MWLQLDTDLLDSPRWLNLSLPARLWYVAMLAHCIETGSGCLDRAEWEATRAMRSKLALLPDEYPDITAAGLVAELASEATHLVDLAETEITVRGFERRYTEICNRRAKDAKRQRERRAKLKAESRVSHADVTRTSKNVTGTEGDVDVDGGAALQAPAPPSRGNGKATARTAHVCADGNGNVEQPFEAPPLPKRALEILDDFEKQASGFRLWTVVKETIRLKSDHRWVLEHLIDLHDYTPDKDIPDKLRLLYNRLFPKNGNLVTPCEDAIREAGRAMNEETEAAVSELPPIDIGSAAKKGKPAASKKKGKKT